MSEVTARLTLPLIVPGQAQKEMAHNEALVVLDLLTQPHVVAIGSNAPPATPNEGQCWVIGTTPSGEWVGHANALAGWTAGGWRFVAPMAGLTVRVSGPTGFAYWTGSEWAVGVLSGLTLTLGGDQVVGLRQPAIGAPTGGSVVDGEARAILANVLVTLRTHGLIAT